jgi:hypothetical protein
VVTACKPLGRRDPTCHRRVYTASMSDDILLWTHRPAPRCYPGPGEPLGSVRRGPVTWSAELRYHGEYGVEAQILRNGDLTIARTFVLRDLAVGGRRTSAIGWKATISSRSRDHRAGWRKSIRPFPYVVSGFSRT